MRWSHATRLDTVCSVTTILTCTTPEFALLASDRAVSYGTSQGIEGSKDRINKTVVLHGQFLLGITGFGELDGLPIDEWILGALNGVSPEIWPTKLAEQATRSIGRIRASAKRKHHTFAAVGFAPSSRKLAAPRHPLRLVISNATDPQEARLDIAATRFTVTSHQHPEHKWADIAAYGQPPPETVLRDAERILRRYEDRNKCAAQGCVELLGRLVSGVSLRSPTVSSACLVSVLPKARRLFKVHDPGSGQTQRWLDVTWLGALGVVIAAPLGIAAEVIHIPIGHELSDLVSAASVISHPLTALAWFLILLGLPAVHGRYAQRAGIVGLVGLIATMLYGVVYIGAMLFKGFVVPGLAASESTKLLVAPGGVLAEPGQAVLIVGWLIGIPLFAVGLLRARIAFPWGGLLPIVGVMASILFFLVVSVEGVLGNIAYAFATGLVYAGFASAAYSSWSQALPQDQLPSGLPSRPSLQRNNIRRT